MLRKIEGKRRKGHRGWDGWMASPTRWTWVWANFRRREGQGSLACCSPWGHRVRHDLATQQQLFFRFFSHIGNYRVLIELSVLYSTSLLIIYFIYSNGHVSVPISQFISPSPLPMVTQVKHCFLNLCLYFCFVDKFICTPFLIPHIQKWYHMIFVFVWLTSFSMIISRCIHVAANDIISLFLMTG